MNLDTEISFENEWDLTTSFANPGAKLLQGGDGNILDLPVQMKMSLMQDLLSKILMHYMRE